MEKQLENEKASYVEIRDKVDELITIVKAVQDSAKGAVSQEVYERGQADFLEKYGKLERLIKTIPPGGESKEDKEKAEDKKAFVEFMKSGESKTLATDSLTTGGYRTLEDISNRIIEDLTEISPIRPNATVETLTGNRMKFDKIEGSTATGWVEEGGTRTETTHKTFGTLTIWAKETYAMPGATQESLDFTKDMEGWLQRELVTAFDKSENEAFVTGNGTSRPEGITTNTTLTGAAWSSSAHGYCPSGVADNLPDPVNAYDRFLTMMSYLKTPYRARAKWFGSRLTFFATLVRYKDGMGRYYFPPEACITANGFQLIGTPFIECTDWPAIAANAFSLGYGDMPTTYTIVQNPKMTILRDPFTSKGKVFFYTTRYVGGKVVLPEAFVLMKIATS